MCLSGLKDKNQGILKMLESVESKLKKQMTKNEVKEGNKKRPEKDLMNLFNTEELKILLIKCSEEDSQ